MQPFQGTAFATILACEPVCVCTQTPPKFSLKRGRANEHMSEGANENPLTPKHSREWGRDALPSLSQKFMTVSALNSNEPLNT